MKTTDYRGIVDPKRLSYRLMKDFSCNYIFGYDQFYYDYFGVLDKLGKLNIPSYDSSNLIDACLERAKSLPNIKLMWSGGIDSTFILACYKATNTPIKVYNYAVTGNYYGKKLGRYISDNFDLHIFKDSKDIKGIGSAYLGSLADFFFFSQHRLIGTRFAKEVRNRKGRGISVIYTFKDRPFISLEQRMKLKGYAPVEIEMTLAYADMLGVTLKSNNEIARFITFTCALPKAMFCTSIPYYVGLDSFFNTQKFVNIAYSQYWHSNESPNHDKKLFKDFIRDIFGSDFGVNSNNY